jgi:hypothetical protein
MEDFMDCAYLSYHVSTTPSKRFMGDPECAQHLAPYHPKIGFRGCVNADLESAVEEYFGLARVLASVRQSFDRNAHAQRYHMHVDAILNCSSLIVC